MKQYLERLRMDTCKSQQAKFLERLNNRMHGITQKCHLQIEKRNFINGNKAKVFYKIFTDSPQHNLYLSVHKYQHNSTCTVQIFLLNPCFLSISCIQLLFFAAGHSNFLEES